MLPDEMYVKRAADDVAAFSFPFLLEGKALSLPDGGQVTEDRRAISSSRVGRPTSTAWTGRARTSSPARSSAASRAS
jgi:hypothetical protein